MYSMKIMLIADYNSWSFKYSLRMIEKITHSIHSVKNSRNPVYMLNLYIDYCDKLTTS